mmetsp:Transcript_151/g.110  ORF Transcript_151/g.110 Transcript_151/m.110 type:complete len:263 (+) Transcript_151:86-874(+)|eukprot:CAMPEP_0194157800 /NCGR_PEP_ID=MMETSP0152-20130528/73381_1 /TAXON_ID=1049557 /ORGANISM="Thalassiothrix antarctica, Strain L6-D1" /LENGTH=262 /DNA_ID=CAMNT_0038866491 /DNA_START=44 /DNA_END=832 /DNA_ORIENTATION=-
MAAFLKLYLFLLLFLFSPIVSVKAGEEGYDDDDIGDDDSTEKENDNIISSKPKPSSFSPPTTTSSSINKEQPPKGSIHLTTLTLDKLLNDGNVWLIEFYAPWCGHCKAFANSYETVAQQVHSSPPTNGKFGRVAKVNGDSEKATASRFNIVGYPSFFVVDGWSVYEYKGPRTIDGLVKYVKVGYKQDDPLALWSSPMGPLGMIQASMFWVSANLLGIYESLVEKYQLSPMVAAMFFAGSGITLGFFTMIFVAVMLSAKVKDE